MAQIFPPGRFPDLEKIWAIYLSQYGLRLLLMCPTHRAIVSNDWARDLKRPALIASSTAAVESCLLSYYSALSDDYDATYGNF